MSLGVHAIFGGFLAGLAVPREGGLAISIMEKMEDVISIVFLPLVRSFSLDLHTLTLSFSVLYVVGSLNQLGSPQYRYDMGLHYLYHRHGMVWEVCWC
jgi:hypothetical protein